MALSDTGTPSLSRMGKTIISLPWKVTVLMSARSCKNTNESMKARHKSHVHLKMDASEVRASSTSCKSKNVPAGPGHLRPGWNTKNKWPLDVSQAIMGSF